MKECTHFENLLSGYALGELNEQDRQRVDKHLADCDACQDQLAQMQAVLNIADSMKTQTASDQIHNLATQEIQAVSGRTKTEESKHIRWSKIMKSNITKSAAAVIIIGILTGIYQLTGSIDGASIALADVAKRIEQMQNCVFEKTTTVFSKENDKKPHNSLVYYTESFLREDIYKDDEEVTNQVYVNYLEGIIVGIDHQMMLFAEKKLTGDDIELGAAMSPENVVSSILSKGDYKKLGRKMVDGVLSDGFEFNDKRTLLSMDKAKTQKITVRLWADVNTKLPVRFEADAICNGLHVSVVQNNPKWNVELESDFFEPKIPNNYVRLHERGLIGINLENWPIVKIQPDMAAEKAGIKDGDVVLKINGNSIEHIKSSDDAQKFLLGKAGEKVIFTIRRGEQIINIEVVREPLPLDSQN